MKKVFTLLLSIAFYLVSFEQDPVPATCPGGLSDSYILASTAWTGKQISPFGSYTPPANTGKLWKSGTGNPSCVLNIDLNSPDPCRWTGNDGENFISTLRLVTSGAGSPYWEITCDYFIWVNEPGNLMFIQDRFFRKTTGSTPIGIYTRTDGGLVQTMTVEGFSTGGPDRKPGCNDHTGVGTFDAFTGNMHREIKDLEVWGGVGEEPLVWMRYGNSRLGTYNLNYGNGHNWNNNYLYSMKDYGISSPSGKPQILIHYPEGGQDNFIQDDAQPNVWIPRGGVDKRLFQYGSDFYLQKGNGYRYHFQKFATGGSAWYQLQDFRDGYQNLYLLTYDINKNLTRVTEPAGRYLQINYAAVNGINVISQVASSDGRIVQYHYATVNDGTLGVRLDSVKYGDGTNALYTYSQIAPGWQPNLQHAVDPRNDGPAVNMQYTYSPDYPPGYIKEEKNGVTGEVLVTLSGDTANRTVCYPNGRIQKLNVPANLLGNTNQYADGAGGLTQYTYAQSGTGFISNETDALNRVITFNTRTIYGNPLEITYPDGSKEKWTRDTLDLVLTHTDELNRVVTYTRDTRHRVTRIDYPDTTFETFTYNSFSQVLDHQKQNGGIEHFVYDSRGLRTSFTDATGNVTTYTYDVADRLASRTDARGNTTGYEYNERGLLVKMTNPGLSFQIYTYDNFGNRTSTTNELGKTWTTVFDEFRRPVTMTDPLGRITTYSYDLPGGVCGCTHSENKPTKITLPGGKITEIQYDVEWRKIRETAGSGSADAATTLYEYDLAGNLVSVIDPKGKQWPTSYDVRNRKKSATDPLGNKTEWSYDLAGNVLTIKRPDNGITTNAYDNMNRLKQSIDPESQLAKMNYDADGNMVKLTDPKNNEYNFEYDALDRKTKMTYPGGTFETYAYDAVGNLSSYANRGGAIRSYTYDNRNRETLSDWSDATPDITRTYDAASRLFTMTSSVSALTYTYTDANELISETQAITGGGAAKTVSYSYYSDGLRNTVTYPGGTVVSYNYTGRNQVSTITADGAPPLATYAYDLNGHRLTKILKNGTTADYAYDDNNRMLNIDNKKTGLSFARFDYGYDNVNRKKYVQRDSNKGDVFSYDAIDQVTGTKYEVTNPDNAPGTPVRTVNYGLDAAGNRTNVSDNGITASYTTNNLNQYTDVGGSALTYTINGNLQAFNGWTYTYDARNRLIKAGDGITTVDFLYDPWDRCVKRTINGAQRFFYYDDWNLIEERNSGDVQINRYVHGAITDEILIKVSPGNTVNYHYDAIGNVVLLTDNTGVVVEKYSYDVFGLPVIKDGTGTAIAASGFGNRFMFTGREFIQEIGLYDYRNRIYSGMLGRFLQPDPLRFDARDYCLYRYVFNSTLGHTDPYGLDIADTYWSPWGWGRFTSHGESYNDLNRLEREATDFHESQHQLYGASELEAYKAEAAYMLGKARRYLEDAEREEKKPCPDKKKVEDLYKKFKEYSNQATASQDMLLREIDKAKNPWYQNYRQRFRQFYGGSTEE